MKSRADLLFSERLSLRKRRLIMAQNIIAKGNYFLVGLGIGSMIGVLFAPKSGEETREYIAKKAREGNELAHKKARELRDRVDETVERGKEIIAQTEGRIATAIDAGVETYNREKSKAHVS
jgi:gas vesicle protein